MAAFPQYLWVAVLGGIFGFMYGFLIGANDVANAFASSVSSKSITLKQAVIIASFCEFGGAYLLGASVTSTVRSKIFDVDLYEDIPEVLMFGMFTSLIIRWIFCPLSLFRASLPSQASAFWRLRCVAMRALSSFRQTRLVVGSCPHWGAI